MFLHKKKKTTSKCLQIQSIAHIGASQSAVTANQTQEYTSQMCTLNSKCNTQVASGLAAQNCQFNSPCDNLAWYSFPSEPNTEQIHPYSAATRIYKTAAKKVYQTKIPVQHTWQAIWPQVNNCNNNNSNKSIFWV